MPELFAPQPLPAGLAPAEPADLLQQLAAELARPAARMLIDGVSGTGKTALAQQLLAVVPHAQYLQLEDVYPGWNGLGAVGSTIATDLLLPLTFDHTGRIRFWDWELSTPAGWREFSPDRPLLVEGVGAITRATAPLATSSIWLDIADDAALRERALQRAGRELYEPYFEQWARQEREHQRVEQPEQRATWVIAPGIAPPDPVYRLVRRTD